MRGSWIVAMVVVLLGAVAGVMVVNTAGRGKVLEQPIAFSHRLHASDNQIPCLYCHVHARRSAVAGIPSVERCMGCHQFIEPATAEVQKLKEYWTQGTPIPWVRVYDQPDFVRFSHKRHVLAGVTCETCHGAVATMDRVAAAVVVNMDRCVACHMAQQASIDCWTCHK